MSRPDPDVTKILAALQRAIHNTNVHAAPITGLIDAFEIAAEAVGLGIDEAASIASEVNQ